MNIDEIIIDIYENTDPENETSDLIQISELIEIQELENNDLNTLNNEI